MPDATREDLRARGQEVLARLSHGTRPPRARPLHLASVSGLNDYTTDALWGSVWARPGLTIETRMLLTLAALISLQRMNQLRTYLNSALNIGLSVAQLEDVCGQCSAQAGFPVTVNALELLRDVMESRGMEIQPLEKPTPRHDDSLAEIDGHGRALRTHLFGEDGSADGPQDVEVSPARALAQIENRYVFGELLQRTTLSLPDRVACTIASLVALRCGDELTDWLGAGLRVGLTEPQLGEAIVQVAHYVGFPAAKEAMRLLERATAPR
jgi:4-carboxymuconolactone decarboxylase